MKISRFFATFLFTASALTALPANATDYLTFSVGSFDAFDNTHDATLMGIEYRAEPLQYNFVPIFGAFANFDGGVYGYAGLNWEWEVSQDWFIIPNFAIGGYSHGDSKDLGGGLEFRSGIEIDYQMPDKSRFGVALNHLSNAGIYDRNPGEENVIMTYSVPTQKMYCLFRACE